MPQFNGEPILPHPVGAVFEHGVQLANWPSAVQRLKVRGPEDIDRLSLGGLLTVSLRTPARDLDLKARVTEFVPNESIVVESNTRLANVIVGLGFHALGNETQVQYTVGIQVGFFGKPFEPFLHQRGREIVTEFVDEFVANVSLACDQNQTKLTA